MKRMFETILVLLLILSLSISGYASGNMGQGESQNIDVTAKYAGDVDTPAVYSVDILWDNMVFTYSETGSMVWNPETHVYEEKIAGTWDKNSADITVVNHSNVEVSVLFTHEAETAYGVTTELSHAGESVKLDAGTVGDVAGADSVTATLTVSGKPNADVTSEGVVVGTVNVKIS